MLDDPAYFHRKVLHSIENVATVSMFLELRGLPLPFRPPPARQGWQVIRRCLVEQRAGALSSEIGGTDGTRVSLLQTGRAGTSTFSLQMGEIGNGALSLERR